MKVDSQIKRHVAPAEQPTKDRVPTVSRVSAASTALWLCTIMFIYTAFCNSQPGTADRETNSALNNARVDKYTVPTFKEEMRKHHTSIN